MITTLRFDPDGSVACLYTEAVDLQLLGRLHVVRATDIRFSDVSQRWEVRCATSGRILHTDPSRAACVAWEHDNLQPGTPVPSPPIPKTKTTMKKVILAMMAIAGLLAACGPDKSELRSELRAIDSELMNLRVAAEQHQAQMS
jgi:hypothetical protein